MSANRNSISAPRPDLLAQSLPSHPVPGAPASPNALLDLLPAVDRGQILREFQTVTLGLGDILSEPDVALDHVWFPLGGTYISMVTPVTRTESLEVGLVGREGMFSAAAGVGVYQSPARALVQNGGPCLRIGASRFTRLLAETPSLRRVIGVYMSVLLNQTYRVAGCGRFHPVEKRLARWILMSQDRAEEPSFPMTQQFLAEMLGCRRAGVSEAAASMQDAGVIRYRRGVMQVVDRPALLAIACDCYLRINALYDAQLRPNEPLWNDVK